VKGYLKIQNHLLHLGDLPGETPLTAAVDHHTVTGNLALVVLLLRIINAAN